MPPPEPPRRLTKQERIDEAMEAVERLIYEEQDEEKAQRLLGVLYAVEAELEGNSLADREDLYVGEGTLLRDVYDDTRAIIAGDDYE